MEFAPNIFNIPVSDGANSVYLVKGERAAIIDSGRKAADAETVLEYWAKAGRPQVQAVILTHRHWDHIAGAKRLVEATGAEVISTPVEKQHIESAETPVHVDHTVADGELIHLGAATLEIVHTPGHTMGSLCVYHREERVLFTGDTVLGSSPTAINPDHGDMALYIESLRKLMTFDARILAPAHGPLLRSPRINIEGLIAHRMAREAQILKLLTSGHQTIDALFGAIYAAEVDRDHIALAKGQIRSHLIKLQHEGKATVDDSTWRAYALK